MSPPSATAKKENIWELLVSKTAPSAVFLCTLCILFYMFDNCVSALYQATLFRFELPKYLKKFRLISVFRNCGIWATMPLQLPFDDYGDSDVLSVQDSSNHHSEVTLSSGTSRYFQQQPDWRENTQIFIHFSCFKLYLYMPGFINYLPTFNLLCLQIDNFVALSGLVFQF